MQTNSSSGRSRSSSSGIKSLASGGPASPYKASPKATKKAAPGSRKSEDAVIETHRQRLQDRVAETSQLMEELSRQKQKLEAKLISGKEAQDTSAIDPMAAAVSAEPWLSEEASDPLTGTTTVASGMEAEMTDLTDGMSDQLREKVQAAIADLTMLGRMTDGSDAEISEPAGALPSASGRAQGRAGGSRATPSQREMQLESEVRQMEEKMAMSRSIMRKLYHANVELEKEVKVLSTSQKSILDDSPQDIRVSQLLASISDPRESVSEIAAANGISPDAPIVSLLKERTETIKHLKMALETSRRRAAALEQSLAAGGHQQPRNAPAGGRGAGSRSGRANTDALKDMLAQSALHFKQYQQIRSNYNSLLGRRTQALSRAPGASKEAKLVVTELSTRLKKEIEEREAEAALYNAKLYESEKQQGDWYVEKRLLEKRIEELDRELKERDEVDSEIESCVGSLFERISTLEQDNQQLRQQLSSMGLLSDGGTVKSPAAVGTGNSDNAL